MKILVCGGRDFGHIKQGERGTDKAKEYYFVLDTLDRLSFDCYVLNLNQIHTEIGYLR